MSFDNGSVSDYVLYPFLALLLITSVPIIIAIAYRLGLFFRRRRRRPFPDCTGLPPKKVAKFMVQAVKDGYFLEERLNGEFGDTSHYLN